ncbi:MAG TPA: apolipoprotein N-acyltransferase [Polyangiales bacterium]|nr:apolipoprotein N-acyltransferase [Polyangiales bacterium]
MPEPWTSRLSGSPPLLAALAGALLLAGPDAGWLAVTGWVGMLGLCEALFQSRSRRQAIVTGWLFGSVANAVALGSLGPLLVSYAGLPAPLAWLIALLAWLLQGAPYALAAYLAEAVVRRGWARWLALGVAFTCSLALCPQLFPWHLASTQVGFLPFAQVAELGGESLLGLCFVVAVAASHTALRSERRWSSLAAALIVFGAPLVYGLVRVPQVERDRAVAPKLALGVVQANAPIPDRDPEQYARESLHALQALTRPLETRGVALTIWGETAYPYPLLRSSTQAPTDVRAPLANGVHGPLLLGLETYSSFVDNSAKYNSAWLVRRDGRLAGRVDKARLIPFGEYVPFWHVFAPLRTFFRSPGFAPGASGTVRIQDSRLGVLICYEDLFAAAARDPVRRGARVLINLTNDVWFGHSHVSFLHDLVARLRAIEQRRDLVRVVNTGRSSFSAASGRELSHSAPFTQASFVVEPALLDGRTPYSLLGDLTAPACALFLLLALAKRRRVRTRSAS